MTDDLGAILEYVDALRALDTARGRADDARGAVRLPDPAPTRSKPSLPVDEALANAPRRDGELLPGSTHRPRPRRRRRRAGS